MCRKPEKHPLWALALLLLLLASFCAPYTMFDEANAYLADTESELVHYYLSPLPDNGEACVDIPEMISPLLESKAPEPHISLNLFSLPRFFFHPPE
ncbi:MAG: hypothetical protein OSJ28_09410 [Desulfovibrio sp.]|jgi:hypothetical protein|nr:hypothetical protein [Desulfovibrio sp.]